MNSRWQVRERFLKEKSHNVNESRKSSVLRKIGTLDEGIIEPKTVLYINWIKKGIMETAEK